jgi:hypothetical protein
MRNNRFFLLVFALVAGLSSLAMTFYAAWENHKNSALQPPDGLVALNDPLDLGDIPQDTLDGTFELINKSKKPVKIIRIAMSCRCTEMKATDNEIVPEKTAKISFKWDTTGVRGVKGSSFTIFYTEEGQEGMRSLPLSVHGNIMPLFDCIPEKLEFTVGKSETKTVKLAPKKEGQSVVIERCGCSVSAFNAQKISDSKITVAFSSNDWINDSQIFPYLSIYTNNPKERIVAIPISVSVYSKNQNRR